MKARSPAEPGSQPCAFMAFMLYMVKIATTT